MIDVVLPNPLDQDNPYARGHVSSRSHAKLDRPSFDIAKKGIDDLVFEAH